MIELNIDTFQVNASELNGVEQFRQSGIEDAVKYPRSPFGNKKIVVLNEVDTLKSRTINYIVNLLKITECPVILIANNDSIYLKDVKLFCVLVRFFPLRPEDILGRIQTVCSEEHINFTRKDLIEIAYKCKGDMRFALNILQMGFCGQNLAFQKQMNIFELTHRLCVSKNFLGSVSSIENSVERDLHKIVTFVSGNISKFVPDVKELLKAYNLLSKASALANHIRRFNAWNLDYSLRALICLGVMVKSNPHRERIEYPRLDFDLNKKEKTGSFL